MSRPKTWDAAGYDADFGFVSGHGAGVLSWLGPTAGSRVLDLGCGTGELLQELLAAGVDAYGLDADPAMVARARQRVGPDRVWLQDGHAFSVPDPYDAVFSNAALHWMHAPGAVIASVRAALRPSGRFVAEMGAGRNMATIVAAIRAARASAGFDPEVPLPWFFPSPAEYARLLEAGGFEVRRLAYFPRPTLLSDGPDPVGAWVEMFATAMVDDLPPAVRAAVVADVGKRTRETLFRDGHWYADYWRLRFEAVLPGPLVG